MKTTIEKNEHKIPRQSQAKADQVSDLQAASALSRQQAELSRQISSGPVMTAQRKKIDGMTPAANPVQRQSGLEDEELMQGKMAAQLQSKEDEELLQGAFESNAAPRTFTDQE